MSNKFILVTGGAGYIGANTCKYLSNQGYTPVVFDNLSTGYEKFVKWGPLVVGDLADKTTLETTFKKFKITSVIHFAAKCYVQESVANPIKYYRENINGSVNLLETFVEQKGQHFIFSSSCAVYGNPKVSRIFEDQERLPINPYGVTKLAIEMLVQDLKRVHQFNFAILRYFNASGADYETEIGEQHDPETHVIPKMVNCATTSKIFKIYGDNYLTPDGSAVRDFVHVTDLAIAHLRALQYVTETKKDLICNLGSGVGTSILELALRMKSLNPSFKYSFEEKQHGNPDTLVASNELSKMKLNIDYTHSNISNILNTASKWDKIKNL